MRAPCGETFCEAGLFQSTVNFTWLAVLAALVPIALPQNVCANPLDTYGFTSRAIAMGGANTAAAKGVDATYYNPAASTRTRHFAFGFGLLVADEFLAINDADADLDPTILYQLALSTPLPLGEWLQDRIFISIKHLKV